MFKRGKFDESWPGFSGTRSPRAFLFFFLFFLFPLFSLFWSKYSFLRRRICRHVTINQQSYIDM